LSLKVKKLQQIKKRKIKSLKRVRELHEKEMEKLRKKKIFSSPEIGASKKIKQSSSVS